MSLVANIKLLKRLLAIKRGSLLPSQSEPKRAEPAELQARFLRQGGRTEPLLLLLLERSRRRRELETFSFGRGAIWLPGLAKKECGNVARTSWFGSAEPASSH